MKQHKSVGKTVAIIGAGGIGFDVGEYISQEGSSASIDLDKFLADWGIDPQLEHRGGLEKAEEEHSPRTIYLLQRKQGKLGKYLGKTTGWIHRLSLRKRHVQMLGGVSYQKIDDQGLHITVNEQTKILAVDNVIVCAGQLPQRQLYNDLVRHNIKPHLIGGADKALELDAKRAINQGARLAAEI